MKNFLKLQKLFVQCCIMLFVSIFSSQAALAVQVQPVTDLTVIYAPIAPCKTNNFTVIVRIGGVQGALIDNATVTLKKDGFIVDSKQTASQFPDLGTAKFSFNLSAGTLEIHVIKPGYNEYVGTCNLNCSRLLSGTLWVSYHLGLTNEPIISWEKFQDYFVNHSCFNYIINLEYRWRFWSVVLDIGYNDFKADSLQAKFKGHFQLWNITPSIRYHIPLKRFKPFINVGPGYYIPREGNKRFGFKAGLGFDYEISDRLLFEMGTDYHQLFSKKGDPNFDGKKFAFQHFHVGVVLCLNNRKV